MSTEKKYCRIFQLLTNVLGSGIIKAKIDEDEKDDDIQGEDDDIPFIARLGPVENGFMKDS